MNISCEVDYNYGPSALTQAFCETISPPRSATLTPGGALTECTGGQCLGNAGVNTPTLQYGQTFSVGPFTCASSTAGVKCTIVSNGDGFLISTSGITSLGNAKVTTSS